jgi:hypothetical protein
MLVKILQKQQQFIPGALRYSSDPGKDYDIAFLSL